MYALVDCNSFYASCEKIFRPDLAGRPVVVLSNNDGCVIARSPEAKALGIPMGAPAFLHEKAFRMNGVAIFSANFELYGDISSRVFNVLGAMAPAIEIYSIDEAFLDFHGINLDPQTFGVEIRKKVFQLTGINTSVGFGPTRTLAKLANQIAKKNPRAGGVHVIAPGDGLGMTLREAKVADVWGIGAQYGAFLNEKGVRTAWDFVRLRSDWVLKNMTVVGLRTQKELLGQETAELEIVSQAKKAICSSRAFGAMQTELPELKEAVATFAARCAEKLRQQQSCCNTMIVFLHTNQYRPDLPQYAVHKVVTLEVASNSSLELGRLALQALSRIFRPGYYYKKAGVIVSGIIPETHVQSSFFDKLDREKQYRVNLVMDQINGAFGRGTVQLAAQGVKRKWRMRQEKLSPRYTTRWNELPEIKI